MKHFIKISAVVFLTLVLFSCEVVDELTEFDINDSFNTSILVAVEESDEESQTFTQSTVINIAENQEVQDNLSAIKNIVINQLSYEFTNYSGVSGAIVTNASLNFGNSSIALSDLNIEMLDNEDAVFNVTDTSVLNAIANALQTTPELTVTISGTIDQSPVSFNTNIIVDVTFTVDPI